MYTPRWAKTKKGVTRDGEILMDERHLARLTACVRELDLLDELRSAAAVIVGYSGGADSSLLLEYLFEMSHDPEYPPVIAVHVNHMLRGDDADSDERFCRERCAAAGIPFCAALADVPAMMEQSGKGAEECARAARYTILNAVRSAVESGEIPQGFDGDPDVIRRIGERGGRVLIATAHNADDNLETVIFNLARGGGASGLSGIPPMRPDGVIRPILGVTSEEVRTMCRECGIDYVFDRTNADTAYTRNFIRREIIPSVRRLSPSVYSAALRAGAILREDEAYFRKAARQALGDAAGGTCAPRDTMAALETPILARALVILMANLTDTAMGEHHISEACRLIKRDGTGRLSMPDGVTLEVSKNSVSFCRPTRAVEPFSFDARLPDDGECLKYECPEAGFDLYFYKNGAAPPCDIQNIYKLFIHTETDFDTIYGRIYVRARQPGDRLQLGSTHRRVKKMLCDRGVPVSMRDRIPALCDGDGIFCVPYLPPRTTARGAENVLHVLYCVYTDF